MKGGISCALGRMAQCWVVVLGVLSSSSKLGADRSLTAALQIGIGTCRDCGDYRRQYRRLGTANLSPRMDCTSLLLANGSGSLEYALNCCVMIMRMSESIIYRAWWFSIDSVDDRATRICDFLDGCLVGSASSLPGVWGWLRVGIFQMLCRG